MAEEMLHSHHLVPILFACGKGVQMLDPLCCCFRWLITLDDALCLGASTHIIAVVLYQPPVLYREWEWE
jgi:hypothetical protein